MNQRKIKAVNTTRFQASFMLVGLVWLACATLTQAAGQLPAQRAAGTGCHFFAITKECSRC